MSHTRPYAHAHPRARHAHHAHVTRAQAPALAQAGMNLASHMMRPRTHTGTRTRTHGGRPGPTRLPTTSSGSPYDARQGSPLPSGTTIPTRPDLDTGPTRSPVLVAFSPSVRPVKFPDVKCQVFRCRIPDGLTSRQTPTAQRFAAIPAILSCRQRRPALHFRRRFAFG